jgi:hypothetical protein
MAGFLLQRFPAKWSPVRVKKTRQNKKLEPGSDSIRTGLQAEFLLGLNRLRLSTD